jgi:hypothetical protein
MSRYLLLLGLGYFLSFGLFGQQGLEDISKALGAGNAPALAQYFHGSVDLTLQAKEGTYSKAQAEQIVQDFFNHHKPSQFQVSYVGQGADGSRYVIGQLTTPRQPFRVYLLFKVLGGRELIQTLRFDVNE